MEKHAINADLRQKGKVAELALGYGGSAGALRSMGALGKGLTEEELPALVEMWRKSNPRIVDFWWRVDQAVKTAIRKKSVTTADNLTFSCHSGMLFIELPSGRHLSYGNPQFTPNYFGGESVTYMGLDAQKKLSRIESYSPKFVEIITQTISRDILFYAMP